MKNRWKKYEGLSVKRNLIKQYKFYQFKKTYLCKIFNILNEFIYRNQPKSGNSKGSW